MSWYYMNINIYFILYKYYLEKKEITHQKLRMLWSEEIKKEINITPKSIITFNLSIIEHLNILKVK